MINKRPHILRWQIQGTAIQDGNGNWVANTDLNILEIPCRADASDKGRTVQTEDGQDASFGYTVYMSTVVPDIPVGQTISLFNSGKKFFEGLVKRFEREQAKCRIWV